MELKDLFVNFKQVAPVSNSFEAPSLPTTLYSNYDRASKAVSGESSTQQSQVQDMSNWTVGGSEQGLTDWRVGSKPKQPDQNVVDESTKVTQTKGSDEKENEQKPKDTSKQSYKAGSWDNPYKNNRQLWKKDMTDAYKRAGLSDNAIRNLIAKNALESAWGGSAQGAYNFGNITPGKYWKGNYVQGTDYNAKGEQISQKFRSYANLDEFVKDEVDFLTTLYDFNPNDDIDTFVNKLQGGNRRKLRYAENPQYVDSVKAVYRSV